MPILKRISLAVVTLFAGSVAFAPALLAQQDTTLGARPTTTMTCTASDGGANLVLPVYAITADLTTSLATSFFTVYTDSKLVNQLATDFFFSNKYNNCSFSPSIGGTSFGVVSLQSVSLAATGPGVQTPAARSYASATFGYSLIVIGSTTMAAKPSTATPAENAKALADHIARGLALPSTK